MKVSLTWLKSYLNLDGVSADEICRAITFLGFEVEQVIKTGAPRLDGVFVGEILTRGKHPNADKLSICTVDVGPAGGVKTIVCGAPNCDAGNRVPVALPGAILPGNFEIKQSKIRGQSSDGMMCSAKELTLSEESQGLLLLPGQPALGTPINDVLPPGDTVFDIEVTPNRPDCLCHLGVARELSAWFKRDFTYPEVHYTPAASVAARPDLLASARVEAPEECPLYSATVITGVKIGPSPAWLQERLGAVGLRPINNIVDITNYVMLEYGQPLHAFDAAKIGGAEIVVRMAREGEKLVTLDGKERTLTDQMLVIADAQRPLVVAGIMGGVDAGVSAQTADIVLEAAVFKRQSVRATSRKLGLSSDSSYRFERNVDPHMTLEAAHRAIDLILELAGGQVAGATLVQGGEIPWKREIVVTAGFIAEKLGFTIPETEITAAFASLELNVTREEPTESRGTAWTVEVPSWRDDLDRPIDLVEEVLRLFGTERIPTSTLLSPGLVGNDDPIVLFNRAVTEALVGQGFNECVNYTLRSAKEVSAWTPTANGETLALANPFVEDQSHLRSSLIGGLLDSVVLNQSRGVSATRLGETGRVFLPRQGQWVECVAVGFVMVQDPRERAWLKREPVDFYSAKRVIETLGGVGGLEIGRQPLAALAGQGWQEGHAASAGDLQHGWTAQFGLVDLSLVKKLGIEGKVYAGQLAILPEKVGAALGRKRFQPFSLFPAASRDLALVVPATATSAEVQKALAKAARASLGNAFALESVQLFDVYQGAGLPEGTKSLGFTLVFRATDRTLTDDEVNAVFTKTQEELQRSSPFQVRK